MQKLVVFVLILTLFLTAGCSVESMEGTDEETVDLDCPFGKIDCEYPGNCARYIDLNNNDICDHSE